MVLVPNPTYPIHSASVVISGGQLVSIPLAPDRDFFEDLHNLTELIRPRPKMLIISFPHNPTTRCVDLDFFNRSWPTPEARSLYRPRFRLRRPGLRRLRGPQHPAGARRQGSGGGDSSPCPRVTTWPAGAWASAWATPSDPRPDPHQELPGLRGVPAHPDRLHHRPQRAPRLRAADVDVYRERRDTLVTGLNNIGWDWKRPRPPCSCGPRFPSVTGPGIGGVQQADAHQGGQGGGVAGIGLRGVGRRFVRFALVENVHRTNQAIRGLRHVLRQSPEELGLPAAAKKDAEPAHAGSGTAGPFGASLKSPTVRNIYEEG